MLATLLALALAAETPPVSPRHITIVGEAKVVFHPSEVMVSLTMPSTGRDAAASKRASDDKVQKLLKALAGAGVERGRIVTVAQNTSPEYRGNEVVSSTTTWTGTVTLTDMARVDEALAAALRAGALPTGGVQLRNGEHAAYETKARIAAATDARQRAVGILEPLGAKVGLPVTVSDTTTSLEQQYGGSFSAGPDGTVTSHYASAEMVVTSRVSVQFDLTAP